MSTKTNDRVVIKRSIGLNELIRQALAVGLPAGPSLYIIHIFTLEVLPATILYRLVYEFHHFDEVGVYHHPHALNGGCFPGFIYVTDYKRDASTHPILRLETEKSRNQATLSACFCQLGCSSPNKNVKNVANHHPNHHLVTIMFKTYFFPAP